MEEKLVNIFRMLLVKQDLLEIEYDNLEKKYDPLENYLFFVETIFYIVENDSEFFVFFSALKDEVLNIIGKRRFDKEIDKNVIMKINKIIAVFNNIDSVSKTEFFARINQYYSKQEELRGSLFPKPYLLIQSISLDFDVLLGLAIDQLDKIPNETLVLASLNYIGNLLPELYTNRETREIAINYLNKVYDKKGLFRVKEKIFVKNIKNNFFE